MKWVARLVVVMLAAGACRGPSVTLIPDSELPGDVYGSPRPTPSPEELPERGVVYLVRRGQLLRVTRPLPGIAATVPEALLLALLLQGARGVANATTAIPDDTRLIDVEVEGTVASVDLSSEFERAGPGRTLVLRIAQVVYTLTEDPSPVEGVRFLIDGIQRDVIGSEELTVIDRPVNRGDYPQFTSPEG